MGIWHVTLRELPVLVYRAAGCGIAIAIMEWLSTYAGEPLSRVPFVTSIVLVMMLPQNDGARPYAVVMGHASACIAGFAALYLVDAGGAASAIGVGLAGFLMLLLRAPHPPAGIDAFLIAGHDLPLKWSLSPVLAGCILLVAFAQAWRWGERVLLPKLDAGEM
jgi:CBS-domain-containing membrane protein